jgi:uncharacterized membrane protein SirB2
MLEFYPQIKWVHVAAAICSGSLFLLRGMLVQFGHGALARRAPLRWASYTIDSVLLTAALMLFTLLPGAVFANGWLLAKLALLVVYIGLGVMALRERVAPFARRAFFVAALFVFATMISIARTHHPLGWLHAWSS